MAAEEDSCFKTSGLEVRAEKKLRFRTVRELREEADRVVPWVVSPWVAAGAITEVIGKPKHAGKTTWLAHMIFAVLSGLPFMGGPTLQTPVIYITEETVGTFWQALRRVGIADESSLRVVTFSDTYGMKWPDVIGEVLNECKRLNCKFVVVDTLSVFANLTGDSENKAGDVLQSVNPLRRLTGEGIAVVLVRHERKGGGDVSEAGRGSSAFTGAVDIVLRLCRPEGQSREGIREIKALSRYDETPNIFTMELVNGEFHGLDESQIRVLPEAMNTVLNALPSQEADAIDINTLMINTGHTRASVQRALDSLAREGRLHTIGLGVRGKPHRYFVGNHSAQTSNASGQTEQDCETSGQAQFHFFSAPDEPPIESSDDVPILPSDG